MSNKDSRVSTKFMRFLMGSFISLGVNCSYGAGVLMDPTRVMSFPISNDGVTRITIENDGIEDILVYPQDLKDNVDHHKSGHIFVVADDIDGHLCITLITRRGVAQDLKLTPSKKKIEPILLRFENDETKQKENQDKSSTLLENFIQGIVPSGFYVVSITETSRNRGALSATVDRVYQNSRLRVLIFTVKNESSREVTLDNRLMWDSGDLALAFDHPHLDVDQSAKMYVVQNI